MRVEMKNCTWAVFEREILHSEQLKRSRRQYSVGVYSCTKIEICMEVKDE